MKLSEICKVAQNDENRRNKWELENVRFDVIRCKCEIRWDLVKLGEICKVAQNDETRRNMWELENVRFGEIWWD